MKKQQIVLQCDLCSRSEAATSDSEAKGKGWVFLSLENPQLDRDFNDRHVCPSCSKSIKQLAK